MVAQVSLSHFLLRQLIQIGSIEEIHALWLSPLGPLRQNIIGHIVDTINKGDGQARIGQLFGFRHSPEAIRQVVMLQ